MELRKIRRGTDISMRVSLTDSGMAVDWTTVEIKAVRVFSDAQKLTVADAAYEIDGDDTNILNVSSPGDGQCYLFAHFYRRFYSRYFYHGRFKIGDVDRGLL